MEIKIYLYRNNSLMAYMYKSSQYKQSHTTPKVSRSSIVFWKYVQRPLAQIVSTLRVCLMSLILVLKNASYFTTFSVSASMTKYEKPDLEQNRTASTVLRNKNHTKIYNVDKTAQNNVQAFAKSYSLKSEHG